MAAVIIGLAVAIGIAMVVWLVVVLMALAFCRAAKWADDYLDARGEEGTTETQSHGEEKDREGG